MLDVYGSGFGLLDSCYYMRRRPAPILKNPCGTFVELCEEFRYSWKLIMRDQPPKNYFTWTWCTPTLFFGGLGEVDWVHDIPSTCCLVCMLYPGKWTQCSPTLAKKPVLWFLFCQCQAKAGRLCNSRTGLDSRLCSDADSNSSRDVDSPLRHSSFTFRVTAETLVCLVKTAAIPFFGCCSKQCWIGVK